MIGRCNNSWLCGVSRPASLGWYARLVSTTRYAGIHKQCALKIDVVEDAQSVLRPEGEE